jgi:plastocyanin
MINTPAKILLALSAFAGVTAVAYGAASRDRSGAVLFAAVLVVALLAAFAVMGSAGADPLDTDDEDEADAAAAAAAAVISHGPDDVTRPSPWPVFAAVAAGLLAVGAAEGPAYVVGGGLLALVVAALWTAQVWREHPSWTPRLGARLGERVLVPGLLPVLTFLLAAAIAISVSRILLAVSKDGSIAIAGAAALSILLGCAAVAYRPRMSGGAMVGLIVVAALFAGTAGVVGAAAGEREFHPEHEDEPGFTIVAKDTAFDKKEVKVPAKEKVRVEFVNRDQLFHNFAVYTPGPDATSVGSPVFAGRPVLGDDEVLEMEIPEPGDYVFVCDFHPNMRGDLVAE